MHSTNARQEPMRSAGEISGAKVPWLTRNAPTVPPTDEFGFAHVIARKTRGALAKSLTKAKSNHARAHPPALGPALAQFPPLRGTVCLFLPLSAPATCCRCYALAKVSQPLTVAGQAYSTYYLRSTTAGSCSHGTLVGIQESGHIRALGKSVKFQSRVRFPGSASSHT